MSTETPVPAHRGPSLGADGAADGWSVGPRPRAGRGSRRGRGGDGHRRGHPVRHAPVPVAGRPRAVRAQPGADPAQRASGGVRQPLRPVDGPRPAPTRRAGPAGAGVPTRPQVDPSTTARPDGNGPPSSRSPGTRPPAAPPTPARRPAAWPAPRGLPRRRSPARRCRAPTGPASRAGAGSAAGRHAAGEGAARRTPPRSAASRTAGAWRRRWSESTRHGSGVGVWAPVGSVPAWLAAVDFVDRPQTYAGVIARESERDGGRARRCAPRPRRCRRAPTGTPRTWRTTWGRCRTSGRRSWGTPRRGHEGAQDTDRRPDEELVAFLRTRTDALLGALAAR